MAKHAIKPLEKNSLNVSTSVVQHCKSLSYKSTRRFAKFRSIEPFKKKQSYTFPHLWYIIVNPCHLSQHLSLLSLDPFPLKQYEHR